MTQKEIEEIRNAIEDFFKLPQAVNDLTLRMIEQGLKDRIYSVAIDALLKLGEWSAQSGNEIKAYNHAEALQHFAAAYRNVYDDKVQKINNKAAMDSGVEVPIVAPVNLELREYEPANQRRDEWRALSLCMLLSHYRVINRPVVETFNLFGAKNSFVKTHQRRITEFLARRNIINTIEAADFINKLIAEEYPDGDGIKSEQVTA